MSLPLDRLLATGQAVQLSAAAVAGFVAEPGKRLLVFPGDAAARPEAQDAAVVALELRKQYPTLAVGVVPVEEEASVRTALAVDAVPAVVFVKHGRAVSTVSRVQPWAVYARAAAVVFGHPEVP